MNSKSPGNCFVSNHQYFEKFEEEKNYQDPQEFYYRFMYIHVAPSSDLSWLI